MTRAGGQLCERQPVLPSLRGFPSRRRLAVLTAKLSPRPCSPVTAGPHPAPAPRKPGRAPSGRAVPPWPRFPPRGAWGPATEAGAEQLPAAKPQPLGVGCRVSGVLTALSSHGGGSGRPFPPAQPDCPPPCGPSAAVSLGPRAGPDPLPPPGTHLPRHPGFPASQPASGRGR